MRAAGKPSSRRRGGADLNQAQAETFWRLLDEADAPGTGPELMALLLEVAEARARRRRARRPPAAGFRVTAAWLRAHASGANGHAWLARQLALVGAPMRNGAPAAGWMELMIGSHITDEARAQFERLGAQRRAARAAGGR